MPGCLAETGDEVVETRTTNFAEAIREALQLEMESDPSVFVAGEDQWGGGNGGVFGVTDTLYERFGQRRVRDTPITETAIVGGAVGAAMAGLRPVVEIMFVDFMGICFDELMNQAAKMRYMTGGSTHVPMVVRCCCGYAGSAAAQHSQSLEALFTHVPGLKTVTASNPADAKGLLTSAIRDDDPVIFLEHKMLYATKGEVPVGEYVVPLGKADTRLEGSDVTIVSWSATVNEALAAAEALAGDGISAEVIDLRSLVPLDGESILDSVAKTHRLVIVHEDHRTCGFGAEVAALVADEGFDLLDAPIKRVAGLDTPIPFSPALEAAFLPNAEKIRSAVMGLV